MTWLEIFLSALGVLAGLEAVFLKQDYDAAMSGWRKAQDGWKHTCDLLEEAADLKDEKLERAYSIGYRVGWRRPASAAEADRICTEICKKGAKP